MKEMDAQKMKSKRTSEIVGINDGSASLGRFGADISASEFRN